MWINNCIGKGNYKFFVVMIASTEINLTLYMAAIVVLSVENLWSGFLPGIIVAWVVLVPVAILWFLLLNLIFLHIYLAHRGLTTYQFIVAQRAEK